MDHQTEKPDLEAVRAAIRSILSQDPTTDRKAASEWLDKLKNSIYAWEICDQLLAAREGIDVSYLAAHMLRQKIAKNFNELPLEYYSSLKDSIINHLQAYDDYAVQGQLIMVVSDLTLLLKDWTNPIEDLAKRLELDKTLNSIPANDFMAIDRGLNNRLLFANILNNMCDLNHNHSDRPCKIGAKRREEYEDYLISKCGQTIFWWLNTLGEVESVRNNLVSANNSSMHQQQQEVDSVAIAKCLTSIEKLVGQIYLCYSAWLRIFDEENVNDTLVLIDMAFRHLAHLDTPDLIHKYAVEAIIATANFCEDNRAVDYLVNHLVKQVYTLEEPFRQSVAREDLEKSSNLVKVFSSVAEVACMVHVIENRDFKLLELLLSCLSHYEFEVVEETYSFWWIFVEYLQNRNFDYGPFVPYVNRFIMSVAKMCQFDPDEESVIEQEQDIHGFRSNSAEIISNVMFLTNIEHFLRDNPVIDTLRMDLSSLPWERVEAILYLLHCLAQMMSKDDNNLRKQIFEAIIAQQTGISDIQTLITAKQVPLKVGSNSAGEVHPQIVATSLQVIGSFEEFFLENPQHLALAINYILTSISDPKHRPHLIRFAASALACIMEKNAKIHFSSCPELLVIVKDLCANLDQCDDKGATELLKCGAFLASALKESTLKDQFLCEIIKPNLEALKGCLNGTNTDEVGPTKYFDRLSVLFSEANLHASIIPELRNLIALIDSELWPIVVNVLQVYASQSGRIIERACRTIRYILRCIKPEWMIQQVAELMINLYKSYPQNSSPLYICSILVDEFANRSAEINQGLFAMLEIFCTLTFTLLKMETESQSQSLLTMKSYPETIDDMMRLFNRFMRKCPQDFVNCKALESIIELSISSLRIDHPEANVNVSKFVASFVALGSGPEYPHIRDAIRQVLGARITEAVIRACLFDIPTQLISEEAQILMTLYSFDKDLFGSWIEATVTNLPKTNIQGIESVTSDQFEDFKKEITTAGSPKKIVNSLRAFARLYI